jgi:hypothetical protein
MSEYAGLRRQFDVGLRFAPKRGRAAVAAKSVAAVLEAHKQVASRLVEITTDGSRVHFTLAICLGTVDDVKAAAPSSRRALALLQQLIDGFASCDPAFVQLPLDRDGRRASMVDGDLRNLLTVG